MRRRFSIKTKRSSEGNAHSSPIFSGSTDWKPSTMDLNMVAETELSEWAT
jgi:hypothetical protein